MRVTLAFPHDGHQPDETIDVDDRTGRQLVHDGLARSAPPLVVAPAPLPAAPPLHGRGSGRAPWAAYAAQLGVAVTDAMSRDDIAAAIDVADVSAPPHTSTEEA